MADSLTNELVQLQKSRCGFKYSDMAETYVREIPAKVGDSINRPLKSFNRNMTIISRFRGIMLYQLEKRFFSSVRRIKRLTQQL